ncbi:MAG: type III pantothenate kinase [Lachnospiraceae bacterium]|nr:type III pantothenate kinase [Lachnospiraceae bacterium]
MILAVDIGNTNIVIGGFEKQQILFCERFQTNHKATSLEYAAIFKITFEIHRLDKSQVQGAIISSVVPSITHTVKEAVEKYAGARVLVVGPGIKTGIRIQADNPAQLGSDLVVGAVAGAAYYPVPLILVDMGTATTVSVIDASRAFIGKLILPGVGVSLDALISRTSQLPKISLEPPKKLIGTNTIDSIKGGILYGTAGAIDGLIDRIQEELGAPCTVVATGGLAKVITPLCRNSILLDEELLLKGLMLLYERNS